MFLIVTSKDDVTADYLIERLKERSINFFRFHPEDLLNQFEVGLSVGQSRLEACILDKATSRELDLSSVNGAYYRKPKLPDCSSIDFPEFARKELAETLTALWSVVPSQNWLNHPSRLKIAGNKFAQLTKAQALGFSIPDTLIETRSREIVSFAGKNQNHVVTKSMSMGSLDPAGSRIVFTSIITNDDLAMFAEKCSLVPLLVQQRIAKLADIRITVVGEKVFAVAIYPKSECVDWRLDHINAQNGLHHESVRIPSDIQNRCIELTTSLGLRFSCIDLLLGRDETYYFLEVNPNGNWAWLESRLEIPLRDAIIDLTLNEAS